jgi:hypothetical protein
MWELYYLQIICVDCVGFRLRWLWRLMSQEEKLKILFHPTLLDFRKSISFLEVSRALLVRLCGDSSMQMKMSMGRWWNDVDRETRNREHERPCTYQWNMEALSYQFCCHAKETIIKCSECMSVAFSTQHTKRMCRVVLSSVPCLALPYFFFHFISHTTRFSKKLLKVKCMFWFSLQICLKHFSL